MDFAFSCLTAGLQLSRGGFLGEIRQLSKWTWIPIVCGGCNKAYHRVVDEEVAVWILGRQLTLRCTK